MEKREKYSVYTVFIISFIILLASPSILMGQLTISEENRGTLEIHKFDTRSLSMGSATVSDAYGRVSMGVNPALTGLFNKRISINSNSNHSWDTNLLRYDATLPTLIVGQHHITARIGMLNSGYDEINYLGSAQFPEPDVNQYHADLTYAFAVTEVFSVGLLQSLSYSFNDDAQYLTYFTDFGIAYAPAENISYGLVLRGVGREVEYEIIETGATTLRSNTIGQKLEIGATFRFPVEDRRPYITMSFANEKRFGEDGLWYKAGLELLPFRFLAVRGGVQFRSVDVIFLPRAGLGFNTDYFRLDYMVAPRNQRGENFHQLGLTFQF